MGKLSGLYFDDFTVGRTFESAAMTLTESQILDFAWSWDPQPFHIDIEAAAAGPFGGLIASGFHSLVVTFRLIHATGFLDDASMGSPGMDEVHWFHPVRPGDRLRVIANVLEQKPSSSKTDRGMVRIRYSTINHNGDTVLGFTAIHILRCRP